MNDVSRWNPVVTDEKLRGLDRRRRPTVPAGEIMVLLSTNGAADVLQPGVTPTAGEMSFRNYDRAVRLTTSPYPVRVSFEIPSREVGVVFAVNVSLDVHVTAEHAAAAVRTFAARSNSADDLIGQRVEAIVTPICSSYGMSDRIEAERHLFGVLNEQLDVTTLGFAAGDIAVTLSKVDFEDGRRRRHKSVDQLRAPHPVAFYREMDDPELDLGIPGLSDYKEIGSGGFAVVYSAFEADAGRRVAIKVLGSVDERGRRRFDRERRAMGQTTAHDNIVTMFRSGYTDPGRRPYLVMEYMSGGSLQDHLENQGALEVDGALELVIPVARGLGFAHSSGIVHKDIKPANILISATGTPKIADFGIAALRDATATSQIAYTLAYAAPETFDTTRGPAGEVTDPRDERSDLYSLAVTFYALTTGTVPFDASNQAALIHQILFQPPRPTMNSALDAFFSTALAKNPNHRYTTAAQFIQALTAATNPTPVPAPRVEPIRQNTTIAAPPTPSAAQSSKNGTSSERTTIVRQNDLPH